MAKEPEDKHGASSADGENAPSKRNLPQDDSPIESPEGSEQNELPLGDTLEKSSSKTESPKVDLSQSEVNESTEEVDSTRDAQTEDHAQHDDPHHAGELDSDHNDPHYDDPYHDEYHHDYHDEHHEEYHDDYHGDHTEKGHGVGGGGGYDGDYYENDDDDEEEEQEKYGGPVKPFLDHLEDLRWMVLKCVVTLLVGMLVALFGAGYIVDFLAGPLDQAQKKGQSEFLGSKNPKKRTIPVRLGDAVVTQIRESDLKEMVKNGQLQGVSTNLAEITSLKLVPHSQLPDSNGSTSGARYALSLHVDSNSSEDIKWSLQLKAYGPLKSFFIALKIGLYGGLTLSIPFLLYFTGQFVLPALRVKEKNWLFKLSCFGTFLFLIGVSFAYFVIMQFAVWASVGFAGMLGFGADEWQAEEYINFICMFMVGMGVAFQLPMILLFLVKIGILDYKKLSKWRMYAVVANLVVSAILTPTGDPFTLLLVAFPLHLLYELSIFIAWIWYRRDAKKEAEEELDD
tara:strand:+ start:7467 stop:8999 length:1533 start_codon:yes stop_codon:yes gene_type:complete